jgi:molybdenum cofactor cytidylyltransferase
MTPPPQIAAILLAAGESSRMRTGQPKQLLPFKNTPLLHHAIATAQAAALAPITVVLGAHAEKILPTLTELPILIADNPHWHTGMGSSLRAGLAATLHHTPHIDAVLLLLADQPLLTPADLTALIALHRHTAKPLIAAAYNKTLGVPALIARMHFPTLAALPDAAGAKALFKNHPTDLATLPLPNAALDIDNPEDYAHLLAQNSAPKEPPPP